ncbi:hypothetical protein BSM4216_2587 [Bacillus smithii]|nr:hypothetical protein BSM4216_2587 [Bacillus smithii]
MVKNLKERHFNQHHLSCPFGLKNLLYLIKIKYDTLLFATDYRKSDQQKKAG